MGARFESSHGEVRGTVPGGRLVGTRVVLEYPSHTATDNLLMAAVLAKGSTVIENAAKEPEVADLAAMLCDMGAVVRGAGTSRIEVEGVDELRPTRHTVVPDRVVAATYLAAVGMAGGEVTIADARPEHMEMILRKVNQMGVATEMGPQGLRASAHERLKAADIATLPYPGVATDYSPLLVAMLTVSDGVGILTENLFSGRFRYVEELRQDGRGHTDRGTSRRRPRRARGSRARRCGPRTSAPAWPWSWPGLAAEGETVVSGAHHIGRGYQDLAGALRSLGAKVTRPVSPPPPADPAALLEQARDGDRVALARLLSYIERGGDTATAVARLAYRSDIPYTVGLTGAPGAGKSTLTDGLIAQARAGWPGPRSEPVPQVGVLAVDPTSPFSGGAILGDRVRMSQHALDPTVFIRSMATRGHLGGLSLAVPDAVRLLGAAGVPCGHRRDRRRRADGGRDRVGRRHDRGRRDPRVGRLHAGQQGGAARGGRRVRHQQVGPAGRAGGPSRPGADARPGAAGCLAARDRGHDGDRRRGRGRPVARRGAPSSPPREHGPAGGPAVGSAGARAAPGADGPHRRPGCDELAAGEEFATAVKALAAGELDPYQAADRLLAE